MLMLGYDSCQNSCEGNRSQAGTRQTLTSLTLKLNILSMSVLHDPSDE